MHADMVAGAERGAGAPGSWGLCALTWLLSVGCGTGRVALPVFSVAVRAHSRASAPAAQRVVIGVGLEWPAEAGAARPVDLGGAALAVQPDVNALGCDLPVTCAWEQDAVERALLRAAAENAGAAP